MNILNVFLEYSDIFKNISVKLFEQWDKVEDVVTRAIQLTENLAMAILQRA